MRRQLTTVRELRKTNRSLALWELYLRGALDYAGGRQLAVD